MSENFDLVRSIYADWERGNYGHAEWADPEIEFALVGGPSPGTWQGVPAMANVWRDFLGAWGSHRVEVKEYRELDRERVLTLVQPLARGKTSGLEVHTDGANLFQIRDAKVTRLIIYWERARAFDDLGLEE